MNCYEFEINLTNFIEGELKQKEIVKFKSHEETCSGCCEKLKEMVTLLSNLGNLHSITAPEQFTRKLHHKISTIENNQQSKTWNWLDLFDFGFNPKQALAFGLSIFLIFSSIFYYSKIENVPNINLADFEKQETLKPSMIPKISSANSHSNLATVNDSLQINKQNINKNNGNTPPIQVVNSKK